MCSVQSEPAPAGTGPKNSNRLVVSHIYKSFPALRPANGRGGSNQRVQVLRDISFEVAEGALIAVIGASGCGKTTLIRIIDGLLPRDSGDVVVNGEMVHRPGADRGVVFQQSQLLPWRTALQNVEFGLQIQKVDKRARRERAEQMLELVGLEDWRDHHPHQLSGGMQQRVGLARALAIDPALLLMDEPFGALDAQTREVLQGELLRIYHATGKTILFITHDLDEAVYLADRVIILTSRPGEVHEIVDIAIPRPRPQLTELKAEKRFFETRAHIWESIQTAARASEKELREQGLL